MNFTEILNLKDKESIDSIGGKVTGIFQNQATPKQKAAGINPQDVVLQDDDGVKIRCKINAETMHLPQDARGRYFKIEAAPDEKGKMVGISKNVYNNTHTVNVYKDAIITGDKATHGEPTPSRPSSYRDLPLDRPKGRVDLDDHVAALVGLVKKVDTEFSGSDISDDEEYNDFLVRLATTVYIQACKDNLIQKREVYQPVVATPIKVKHCSVENIVDQAFAGTLTSDDVKRLDSECNYNWEEIYDEVADRLVKKGHDRDDVNAAFDDAKAHFIKRTQNFSSPEFCKVVLTGVPSFVEAVETAHENGLNPKSKSKNDDKDSIPF